MAEFTSHEQADIIFMYGRADGNASLARRLYQERYPNRRVPNVRVFSNTYRRLSESGIHHAEPAVNPGRHNVNVEEQILAAFEADPTTSIRVVARDWSTMHNEKKYPFHGTVCKAWRKRIRRDGSGETDTVPPFFAKRRY
ncbi:uncharacterized protein [Leptinotarsa decemlineata]|uniref:uncharacterized protein n=1 Tax=Leptinotarsa decemlineata TaxID=7539 RepID=UPI003D30B0E5